MAYFDIYKKRVNRWGNTYQDRILNMRIQNFEEQLRSSIYLVSFPYGETEELGEFIQYKQDETETLHYLLTRHNVLLEPGTLLYFTNKYGERICWMVWYIREQESSGYNTYIMLRMNYTVRSTADECSYETPCFFYGSNTNLKEVVKSSSVMSILFENDNLNQLVMPRNDNLKKDDCFEIEGQWYRVSGFNKVSTKGVEYVTVDPICRVDTTPKPTQTAADSDEDFFWLNGGN